MTIATTALVQVGRFEFSVKELTVGEIRSLISNVRHLSAVDVFLIDGISLSDLERITSLTSNDLNAMTPTEVRQVWDLCKKQNEDFFSLRRRLMALAAPETQQSSAAV